MKRETAPDFGGVMLAFVGCLLALLLLGFSGVRVALRLGLTGETIRASGVVVSIDPKGADDFTVPDVQFNVRGDGQFTQKMTCWPLGCFGDTEIGSRVAILYPAQHPELAMADTLQGWIPDMAGLLLGAGLLATLALAMGQRSRISEEAERARKEAL